MAMEFTIPGTLGPRIEVRRPLIGGVQLFADGERVKRHGRFRGHFEVRASDGKTYVVRLNRGLTALKVRVADTEIPLERPLTRWEMALMLLPVGVLLFVGGVVGAIFGGIAMEINRRLARSDLRTPSRGAAMVGVGLGSVVLWFVAALGLQVLVLGNPHYEAGSCLKGIDVGTAVSAEDARTVDCDLPHKGEVVANIEFMGDDWPGEDGLLLFGSLNCRGPFETYVGLPYDDSRLNMVLFWPSHITWLTGDRTVDCIAVDPDGEPLVGSVRGSGE